MSTPVRIVGAGWAGLAAAVTLSHQGVPVHVYESARQIGGRARSVSISNGQPLDNGQHLMIGAYRQMLQLLDQMGADLASLFYRYPQQLKMIDASDASCAFQLKLPRLPAPLHLLTGMLTSPSLNWTQKLQTLLRFNRLLNTPIGLDISVADWLAAAGLPDAYVENLLKPLCLAALTTPVQQASAHAFQNVLRQTFNGPRANTDLLIAKKNLGQVFPDLARACIESHGGKLFTGHRVQHLVTEHDRVTGIDLAHGQLPVEQLILATPPPVTRQLLSGIDACEPQLRQLQALSFQPITTVYLQYAPELRLEPPMIGLLNATAEWLFDRRLCEQPGLLAAVISAGGDHDRLSKQALIERIAAELQQLFGWPMPQQAWVIREKRAAFSCTPDIDKNRPGPQTPVSGLHLCGDYVYSKNHGQAGLPSTLEGALRSGVECATQVLKELS